MRLASFASPLLLLSAAAAQGVTSPVHFANAEAPAPNRFPMGDFPGQVMRYLQVHDDIQGQPRPIRTLSLRRWGAPCTTPDCTTPYPAYTVSLSAWCSTATTTSATIAGTFDQNHGNDKAQVVANKTFNFPTTGPGEVPQPFVYKITFDTPFGYLATGPLCWEVQVTARTNTMEVYHSATTNSAAANPPLATVTFGTGCRATGRTSPMSALGGSTMSWPAGTGNITVTGAGAPANAALLMLVGFRNDNLFGIPLPFLVPLTTTAPSGPCTLYTDIRLVVPAVADGAGAYSTGVAVPATPDLNGARTFEQVLAPDAAANPAGVVLSNGIVHNFVAPYGLAAVSRVWVNGSLSTTGTVGRNQGVVTRFDV